MQWSLDEALEFEVEAQMRAFHSDDFHEGINAFLAKRTARFNRKASRR
jgi:enoyl-CoA hydratase/carnithine racemase